MESWNIAFEDFNYFPIIPTFHSSIQLFENWEAGTLRQRVQPWKRGV